METRMLFAGLALAAVFACAYAAAFALVAAYRRRKAALAAQEKEASVASFAQWRLRNGFRAATPAARWLLSWKRVDDVAGALVAFCEARGWATTRESVVSVSVVVALGAGVLVGIVAHSPVAAVAVPLCLVVLAAMAVAHAQEREIEQARDSVPVALESMSACFGSGFTLLQTFQQVASDIEGPLGETFGRSANVLEMGGGAGDALEELRRGAYASELAFVAVALDVQHQSGGSMRQVLDAASDTVKGELALKRSLRVQTAQSKLSARVVAIIPIILVAAFSLISPDFLSPFFSSVYGYALLTIAVLMQIGGIVLVHRALAVDGVS